MDLGFAPRGHPWPRRLAWAVPLPALLLAGCVSGGGKSDSTPIPQTYTNRVLPILRARCEACHGNDQPGAGLVLTADLAHRNLVGVASTQATNLKRVEPGLPDQSYLVFKLAGRQGEVGGSGEQMPKTQLSDEEITLIQDWIVKGAKNE